MTDGRRRLAGRYRLDDSLGRGGMSEVFHGYDEHLDRRVAIKLLRPPSAPVPAGPDSPEAVEILDAMERDRKRFLREIRTTAQLEHPGTPAVYDTGVETAPDGSMQLWLVMQLLRGSTLEAVLDRRDYTAAPPSLAWAVAIAAQIAAVLDDVHRVDIVHRDIKPANVILIDGGASRSPTDPRSRIPPAARGAALAPTAASHRGSVVPGRGPGPGGAAAQQRHVPAAGAVREAASTRAPHTAT